MTDGHDYSDDDVSAVSAVVLVQKYDGPAKKLWMNRTLLLSAFLFLIVGHCVIPTPPWRNCGGSQEENSVERVYRRVQHRRREVTVVKEGENKFFAEGLNLGDGNESESEYATLYNVV